ncbi:glycosyltransferase family 4 protein [Marivirga harenae]|uniref:glycosyltransferase family 4 protein n=1 Tax=Marivirga harenae TaxID=2010992 RepID=UPI0026E038F7|nr:glycosyltransferase family 4 protein [Marivirga harenae]WKV13795.1 glycosyltransferase family 4 protein [Marivirga harenae]|tara:strand:- start:96532 stop:97629 length:1098 start_codon:yes stop_codon:yes gene_type:complete
MKILHLSSESSWRGGEQQIAYLIEELDKMGVEPLVACKPNSKFEELCIEKGWQHYPLNMKNSTDFKSGIGLKKLCHELSIDIVHVHSSHSHGTAYLSYLLGNKTPVVLTRRVDFELKNNFFSKHKYTFPKIKKIACVSDAIREIVIRTTKQPEKCVTIYSAINHKKFEAHIGNDFLRKQYKIADDITLIGNTSAIAPHKDYFTFVDSAYYYIQNFDKKVKFFIIGKGELEREIKDYIKKLKLEDYFIFTGFLKNIEEVLPSLDIFFISSKTEGLGTSVIDAFAAKVPVVGTKAGGIPELVKNLDTGLIAEVKDSKSLAENLFELKKDEKLQDQLIHNAYEYSLKFNTKVMAEKYLNLYQEIKASK